MDQDKFDKEFEEKYLFNSQVYDGYEDDGHENFTETNSADKAHYEIMGVIEEMETEETTDFLNELGNTIEEYMQVLGPDFLDDSFDREYGSA